MQIFEVSNSVPAEHFIKMSNRVQMLQALNSELLEALQLADAAMRGANIDRKALEKKVSKAIERVKEFGYE